MQLHCDSVRERLPESAPVHCLGDAGFFIDHQSVNGRAVYRESMAYAFRMHNATASVNEECVATKAEDLAWMCMFADYSLPHIRTPFFMVCMPMVSHTFTALTSVLVRCYGDIATVKFKL